jgi:hypothetical protein
MAQKHCRFRHLFAEKVYGVLRERLPLICAWHSAGLAVTAEIQGIDVISKG